jgi:hypothetical protein
LAIAIRGQKAAGKSEAASVSGANFKRNDLDRLLVADKGAT